jgi:hypothetical protein
LALQRRRFFIAMTITVVTLILAMIAFVGAFAFHVGWMLWVFAASILAGFVSHGWLMIGVLRDRSTP